MKISLVIPFYNEEKQIPETMEAVLAVMNGVDCDYEILLIDDGSQDHSWQWMEQYSAYVRPDHEHRWKGRVLAFRFSRNFGKESALSAGLHEASGDAVIVMDGDLQHPPKCIPEMIALWRTGQYDVVEGVKKHRKNDRFAQRINAFLFYKVFAGASGYDLMNASDFKLLDRKVVDQWKSLGEHDTFFRALSAWLGFRRVCFEFDVVPRKNGVSRWPVLRLARLSINAITSFSAAPLHLITGMGVLSVLISLALGIQTLVRWATGTAATGFTTVILLVLIIGGLVMISLGLIGIYIERIFTEVKGRPRFIISQNTRPSIKKDDRGAD
jgi:polyisoprenyl-phosphate glycosyltransferase